MNLLEETLTLSKSVKETIAYELGDELLAILEDDKPVKGLSIMDHDDNVRSKRIPNSKRNNNLL